MPCSAVTTPSKASSLTYAEPATLVSPQEPAFPTPVVTVPAAAPPADITTSVVVPPPATGPSTPGPTAPPAIATPSPGAEVPYSSGMATPVPADAATPTGTASPVRVGTKGTVDWAQAGEKTKTFFRQFTRWDTTKAFFRWLGSKIEQYFGWAYQKAFKKVPNQKTTWSCILLMAGIVVAFIIVGAALNPGPLLVGTWHTPFATTFNIQTDANTGTMQYEGYQQRTMTWKISTTFNPTILDVEVSFTVVSSSINSGAMYVPDISPNYYTGKVSGTRLTLSNSDGTIGDFSFTSTSIMGTWNDSWCMIYCQAVYTSVNGLTLVR
jgi:hypothetical protein